MTQRSCGIYIQRELEGNLLLVRTGQGERLVKETMDDPIGKIYREPIRIK